MMHGSGRQLNKLYFGRYETRPLSTGYVDNAPNIINSDDY